MDSRAFTRDEFCAVHPYPFLVFSKKTTTLRPVAQTKGLTVDRLQLGPSPRPISGASGALADYVAAPIRARTPGRRSVELTVGCSSMCDVQINDSSISKLHAYLVLERERWYIRDAQSLAGTKVNDHEPRDALQSGDRISIGLVDLIFLDVPALYELLRRLDGGVSKQTPPSK